ncbi:MAG: Glucose-1-phosphate cytidylyltransferase [Phycisphaerae bacterium]|nr:Glucose-1-phosphate cytidylyltransferase [Phycisphaerae bacterium]
MKVVILAGGRGTRLSPLTEDRPKPMVEVGGQPILWHIMQHFARFGLREFLIPLGYRGHVIKEFFLNYRVMRDDVTLSLATGAAHFAAPGSDDWTVHLLDTGVNTQTGGRVKRLERHLREGTFVMTYGDGIADVDIRELLAFHRRCGRLATVTAVRPPARFGHLELDGEMVRAFTEKPQAAEGWINGGFFVLEPPALDYIAGDHMPWENEPLQTLARDGQLSVYRHHGFWQCVDTPRDLILLENLWRSGEAPWRAAATRFQPASQVLGAAPPPLPPAPTVPAARLRQSQR